MKTMCIPPHERLHVRQPLATFVRRSPWSANYFLNMWEIKRIIHWTWWILDLNINKNIKIYKNIISGIHLAFDMSPHNKIICDVRGSRSTFDRSNGHETWCSGNPSITWQRGRGSVLLKKLISKVIPRMKFLDTEILQHVQEILSCAGVRVTGCITETTWSNKTSTRHGTPNHQLRSYSRILAEFDFPSFDSCSGLLDQISKIDSSLNYNLF